MKFITLATATAIVACSAGFAAAQQTITVNIGSSHPEQNIWVYAMKNTFEPEVNRILEAAGEYKINWVESYGGTLYKFTDTREAVMDGIVDVGMVGTVWEGANMPLQNVTYFTPFATEDHKMIIEIFDDLSENLPELRDSWAENGMVHLSSLITDSYDIYATFPVNSMGDLANRKLNAPGTSANWLRGTGATPVDGALTTYYTNIQTGVTEGTLSLRRHSADPRLRSRAGTHPRGHRFDVFRRHRGQQGFLRGLPEPVQKAFREAAKATSQAHGQYVEDLAKRALTEMQAAGLTIHELPEAEKTAWVNGLPNIVEPWLEQTGDAGRVVLKAYFDALRAHGAEPLRAWDEGL